MAGFSNCFSMNNVSDGGDDEPEEILGFKTEPLDSDEEEGAYEYELDGQTTTATGTGARSQALLVELLTAKCNSLEEEFRRWRRQVEKRLRVLEGSKNKGPHVHGNSNQPRLMPRSESRNSDPDFEIEPTRHLQLHPHGSNINQGATAIHTQREQGKRTGILNPRSSEPTRQGQGRYRQPPPPPRRSSVKVSKGKVLNKKETSLDIAARTCPTCKHIFRTVANREAHPPSSCTKILRTRQQNTCKICRKIYKTKTKLRYHEKSVHGAIISVRLPKKGSNRARQEERVRRRIEAEKLKKGERHDHDDEDNQRSPAKALPLRLLRCPEEDCDCSFNTPDLLQKHLTVCRRLRRAYDCPNCEMSFAIKARLLAHQTAAHSRHAEADNIPVPNGGP